MQKEIIPDPYKASVNHAGYIHNILARTNKKDETLNKLVIAVFNNYGGFNLKRRRRAYRTRLFKQGLILVLFC